MKRNTLIVPRKNDADSTGFPPRRHGEASRMRFYDPLKGFKYGLGTLCMLAVFSVATLHGLGFYYGQDWSLFDCLFMVVITLSTVGYGDVLGVGPFALAKAYYIFLNISGVLVQAFVISNVTALIVEGLFHDIFRRKRMERQIKDLKNHIIVCGAGTTGVYCIQELVATGRSFVVIDRDGPRLNKIGAELGVFPYLIEEADDDEVLVEAGILRASGLIACLTDDKDNLYVTLSARRLNPKLRIVSKAVDENAGPKLLSAGADRIVNPTAIGGMRLVSEMVRPVAVTFLDTMLRDHQAKYRFEELEVERGSKVDGKTLAEADIRSAGDLLVVAVRKRPDEPFTYNPSAHFILKAGTTLIVLGNTGDLKKMLPSFAPSRVVAD